MPRRVARGLPGVPFQAPKLTDPPSGHLLLSYPRAHLQLTRAPALVARAQGGLTLGPEQGELDADFCHLGKNSDKLRRLAPLYLPLTRQAHTSSVTDLQQSAENASSTA
jgi:hypothetical protein